MKSLALFIALMGCESAAFVQRTEEEANQKRQVEPRIAVIGGGVTGLGAAYCLDSTKFKVTLFEERPTLGGNAHNEFVETPDGQVVPADDAFGAFWPERYPHFTHWLRRLEGVEVELMQFDQTFEDMYHQDAARIVSPINVKVTSLRMMKNLLKVRVAINSFKNHASMPSSMTIKEHFDSVEGIDRDFVTGFFYHIIGPVYYSDTVLAEDDYPAGMIGLSLTTFLRNQHTILKIKKGCTSYVEAAEKSLEHVDVKKDTKITRMTRKGDAWILTDSNGNAYEFDKVIMTCPPNEAEDITKTFDPELAEIFGAIPTVPARSIVHSDETFMPKSRSLWSFYNYKIFPSLKKPIATVWNGQRHNKAKVFTTMEFGDCQIEPLLVKNVHAVNHFTAIRATKELLAARQALQNKHPQGLNGLYFAGAWMINTPSHERGLESGLDVAELIDPELPRLLEMRAGATIIRLEEEARMQTRLHRIDGFLSRSLDPWIQRVLRSNQGKRNSSKVNVAKITSPRGTPGSPQAVKKQLSSTPNVL